jgi:Rod binding domain-containing protein
MNPILNSSNSQSLNPMAQIIKGKQRTGGDSVFGPARGSGAEGTAANGTTRADQAKEAAEKLVSTTFIKPILSEARKMDNAPAPFKPTQAEKMFGAMLDNKIADELVAKLRLPLAQRMTSDMVDRIPESERGQVATKRVDILG